MSTAVAISTKDSYKTYSATELWETTLRNNCSSHHAIIPNPNSKIVKLFYGTATQFILANKLAKQSLQQQQGFIKQNLDERDDLPWCKGLRRVRENPAEYWVCKRGRSTAVEDTELWTGLL